MTPTPGKTQTLREHLRELRSTVLFIVGSIFAGSVLVHVFREPIITFLLRPLGDTAAPLQFLSPLDPLFFILKIDFTLGFILTLPLTLFFIWRFVSPASSLAFFVPLAAICISGLLATLGGFYTYQIIVPSVLGFMSTLITPGTAIAYTAQGYISFFLSTALLAILIFQLPMVIFILTYVKLLDPRTITAQRPYIYTGLFIITAIITPTTDVLTLFLIALPAIAAVELGVMVSLLVFRHSLPTSNISEGSSKD